MSAEGSRPHRITVPSTCIQKIAEIADAIFAPRKKPTKSSKRKRPPKQPIAPPPKSSQSSDIDDEPVPMTKKRELAPVNVDELLYVVNCVTILDDKKIWFDVHSCNLKQFKVHDANTKSIIVATREAEKVKMGIELSSSVATITGTRAKQMLKVVISNGSVRSLVKPSIKQAS